VADDDAGKTLDGSINAAHEAVHSDEREREVLVFHSNESEEGNLSVGIEPGAEVGDAEEKWAEMDVGVERNIKCENGDRRDG